MAHHVQGTGELRSQGKGHAGRAPNKENSRHQGKRISQLHHTTSHK